MDAHDLRTDCLNRPSEGEADGRTRIQRVSVLLKHHCDGTMFGIFRRHRCIDGIWSILGCQTMTLYLSLCLVSDVTFNDLMVPVQLGFFSQQAFLIPR